MGVGGGLATTSGLVFGVVVDEHHLYVVGDLGEAQDGVGGPLQAGDAAVVEGDFLVQRAAERLDDVALYLVVQAVGADDKAAAKLGAVQFHRIAQDVEQHGVGLNVDILRAAVNFQLQFTCHFLNFHSSMAI